ncbi:4-hydroxythreonine-4-phosphate dehydrogenase PdxA [Paracoccaceae bacterium GXU_MW_L88]
MGDPAGVGPEITQKAWGAIGAEVPFFVIGDAALYPGASVIETPEAALHATSLPVLHRPLPGPVTPGQPTPENAAAIIDSIREGVDLVTAGAAGALCTNPINKAALKDGADFAYPGHTEFLAALTESPRPVMMLAGEGLRVVPVTIHIALEEVPAALTPDLIEETIRITDASLRRMGIARPRLAVAGLNPHAGEQGKMGRAEIDMIGPPLERLKAEGLAITGPHPADTMFHPAARARYDVAICMYHDQALIPIKTVDFAGGVNVTLGLPITRTSPDHGTAYDIAGQGVADAQSLIAALKMAAELA